MHKGFPNSLAAVYNRLAAFASSPFRLGLCGLSGFAAVLALHGYRDSRHAPSEEVAFWSNVGGCGSSGGGAAAGAGKWIGRGVSGGLVDVEVLSNKTLGGDYDYSSQALSTTFHFPKHPEYTAATTSTSANSAAAACTYDRSAIIDDGDITSSDALPPTPRNSQIQLQTTHAESH